MVKQSKNKRPAPRKGGNRRRGGRNNRGTAKPSPFVSMLNDPCNSTLTPGIYGTSEGLLARLKRDISITAASSTHAGYYLWIADTTGRESDSSQYSPCSLYGYNSASTTAQPTNTVAAPMGTGAIGSLGGSGYCVADPAATLLDSTSGTGIARDARTLSACMRMTYTGAMSASAGQVAILENVPAEILMQTPDVDTLFELSTSVSRLGVGSHEVKFRPGSTSQNFRQLSDTEPSTDVPDPDVVFETGVVGAAASSVHTHNQGIRCFGIAFRGLGDDSSVAFEFIKNVEWRPAYGSGLPVSRPLTLYRSPPAHDAELALDRASGGGWSYRHIVDEAGHIATQALTGAGNALYSIGKGAVANYATRAAIGFVEDAAPMLLM